MRQTALVAAAAIAASAVLVGCEDAVGGSPTTPGEGAPTSQAAQPVPAVKEPLSPDKFLDKPCTLLPKSWASQRGFEAGKEDEILSEEASPGPTCAWSTPVDSLDDEGDIQLIIETMNRKAGTGGLKGWYEQHQAGRRKLFELTEVAGYPAAYVDDEDQRAAGDIELKVGIQDDLTVSISSLFYDDHPENAEPEVRAAAEEMIKTLKAAQ